MKKHISTSELRPKQSELLTAQENAIRKLEETGSTFTDLYKKFEGFVYEQTLLRTLYNGTPKFDRTGTDTLGIHGYQSRFNLNNGFPLITTKKVHLKSVIHELIWLLRGNTNIKDLADHDVMIWHDWPFKNWWMQNYNPDNHPFPKKGSGKWHALNLDRYMQIFHEKIKHEPGFAEQWGELGPVYGKQWRKWKKNLGEEIYYIDQIAQIVTSINKQHETGVISRRMVVTAWNPADIEAMSKTGLPPCHCLFQFHSRLLTLQERKEYYQKLHDLDWSVVSNMTDDDLDQIHAPIYQLDVQLYQRSCDIFLGVPFNIASYALLTLMMAQVTNCKPGEFIHSYGDVHIYSNHLDQVVEQLLRDPIPYPTMCLNTTVTEIDKFKFEDFKLENYHPHPTIKADVAI